jgi:hypothetical protein
MRSRPALRDKPLSFATNIAFEHRDGDATAQGLCQRKRTSHRRSLRDLFLIYAQTQLIRKPSAYTFNMKTANGRAVLNFRDGLKICVRD